MKKLHFISGLPRSGSTLLSAILRQNPSMHAGMSSPLAGIITKMQEALSHGSEGNDQINNYQRHALLENIFSAFYLDNSRDIIFDTSRAWAGKISLIKKLFPESKIVCCVRDIPWILDSLERLFQSNPLELSGIIGFNGNSTVVSRINSMVNENGIVGYAINALQSAYWSESNDKILLVDYEALAKRPEDTLRLIYQFIDQPWFDHNFNDVHYEADDFDMMMGTPGLHKVNGPVKWSPRDTILPPQIFQRFKNDSFWKNQDTNTKKIPVIMFKSN